MILLDCLCTLITGELWRVCTKHSVSSRLFSLKVATLSLTKIDSTFKLLDLVKLCKKTHRVEYLKCVVKWKGVQKEVMFTKFTLICFIFLQCQAVSISSNLTVVNIAGSAKMCFVFSQSVHCWLHSFSWTSFEQWNSTYFIRNRFFHRAKHIKVKTTKSYTMV